MTEEIIDESNFNEHFFDVRLHKPQRGQIMARYAAVAEFVNGRLKKDIIDLIYAKNKPEAATRVMRKLGCAAERDAIRVCREIARDLVAGLTPQEVEEKIYKYTIEVFYYTFKENVPVGDPHWSTISLKNLDEFLDAADNKLRMKTKIIKNETDHVESST